MLTTNYKYTCPHTKQNLGSILITTLINKYMYIYIYITYVYVYIGLCSGYFIPVISGNLLVKQCLERKLEVLQLG